MCYACQTGSVVASEESTGCDDRESVRFFDFETFKKARENGTQT
jgi:hypothetical protein